MWDSPDAEGEREETCQKGHLELTFRKVNCLMALIKLISIISEIEIGVSSVLQGRAHFLFVLVA